MDRRAFIGTVAGGLLTAPLAAVAQQAGKTYRVGLILTTSPVAAMAGPNPAHPLTRAFVHEMRDRGYVEGQNFILERRSLEGKAERGPEVVAELVRLKVEVIVVPVNSMVRDAKRVTTAVPIVMAGSNAPVEASVSRVAYVGTKADWASERGLSIRAAARALEVNVFLAEHGPNDYTGAFSVISREHADALITSNTPHHFAHRRLIAEFALKNRLPSMSRYREFVEAGGLMSYAVDGRDNYRRAAVYVDKILKGAKPADLPVEQPSKFELVINLKTAKALGLTIPRSLLQRADQVIDP